MNVLIVYAHPEPKSLNGSLKDFSVRHLQAAGHSVQVSDLYGMGWKAVIDANDSTVRARTDRFEPAMESMAAFQNQTQTDDITSEQNKLMWADMVIFQFPLWWYSMPAILKGWFERVYACGFAYGVGEHSDARWGERFGEGMLVGKRAMLIVTTGGWQSHYSERGINGSMNDLLFPIQHGILFYPGMEVLQPHVVYRTGKIDETRFSQECEALAARLDALETDKPIAFRHQNAGDYDIPALTLRDGLAISKHGFDIHIRDDESENN